MGTSNMVSFESSRLSRRMVKFLYKEVQYLDSDGKHITVVIAWKEECIFSEKQNYEKQICLWASAEKANIYKSHI